jgi:hypothetical protein
MEGSSVARSEHRRRIFVLYALAGTMQISDLSSTTVLARALALSICFMCWPLLARGGPPAVEQHPGRAVIVGSSSIRQAFGRVLARALEQRGYRVTRKGVTSAGFARPDFRDMNAVVDSLAIGRETALALVYLGTNDAQSLWLAPHERNGARRPWLAWSDRRWSGVYERRVRRFIDRICARGVKRVVLLLPVDVVAPRLQRRLERVRGLQARAARASRCGVAVATSGDRGRFHAGGIARRGRDGFHMTEHGARVVWARVRERALPSALYPELEARAEPASGL